MSDWFQTRYAVRLPDGQVAKTVTGAEWIWDSAEDADRACAYFKAHVEQLGVHDWHGEVVRQLCTPWIGQHGMWSALSLAELARWLEEQTGGAQ